MERSTAASGAALARSMRILAGGGVLLALALGLLAGLPAQAHAETVTLGDLNLRATEGGALVEGEDYSYEDRTIRILSSTPVTVSMREGANSTYYDHIVIPESNAAANVTLESVNINMRFGHGCAFQIEPGASANITLIGNGASVLQSDAGYAGLEVARSGGKIASVTIGGGGGLAAECYADNATSAGIGGSTNGFGRDAGNITITGGNVGAGGGEHGTSGAGIGGAEGGSGGNISITGGRIAAYPGGSGSPMPIGGGAGGSLGTVSITGGLFHDADGSVVENKVYGIEPAAGCLVYGSGDAGYPYAVSGPAGEFEVVGGELGAGYSYDYASGVLSVETESQLEISMRNGVSATRRDRIVVPEGKNADIVLAGVDINLGGNDDCAFQITPGASARITLAEGSENFLISGRHRAGLEVSRTGTAPDEAIASVSIEGKGSLTAKCVNGGGHEALGAGIGGGSGKSAGKISISGGTVSAECGDFGIWYADGAGIGGGAGGSGGEISLSGGTVSGTCSSSDISDGAGIGGGSGGSVGKIYITGGTVNASSHSIRSVYGAGIGGGDRASGGSVTISDGTVSATNIGGNGSEVAISGGRITAEMGYDTVNITGGLFGRGSTSDNVVCNKTPAAGYHVFDNPDPATKDAYPVEVDLATGDFKVEGGTWGTDYSFDRATGELSILTGQPLTLSMRDGVLQTTSDHILVPETNAGANITLSGVKVDVSSFDMYCAFAIEPGASASITLIGENSLVSGGRHAGLEVARANDVEFASATIGGEGSLTAKCVSHTDNAHGAGIGGSGYVAAGKIAITGGTVIASCESFEKAYGAGIGGGLGSSGGEIAISGGRVMAQSGIGEDIGNGYNYGGNPADVSITGGLFARGHSESNEVYGVTPADGRCVYDSGDTAYPYTVGWAMDFQVEGGTQGEDYSFDYTTGVLSINKGTPLVISMREGVDVTASNRIVVPDGAAANLALAGVNVDASGSDDGCAFQIVPGASANITLTGDNFLVSGRERAGLEVSRNWYDKYASVFISGTGSLTAKCVGSWDARGAGIGGTFRESAGNITISGGTVNASCEGDFAQGAGIGGGERGSSGIIEISGGTVNASCKGTIDAYGSGIGGRSDFGPSFDGAILISGGTVNASCEGGEYALGVGIGGRSEPGPSSNSTITITGGTANAACMGDTVWGSGIGGDGDFGGTVAISGGRITVQTGFDVKIGGSTVEITGGLFGEGSIADDTVYGISVGTSALACAVAANPDNATSGDYPVGVGKKVEYAPALAPNGGFTYTGSALEASDFSLSDTGALLSEDVLAALKGAATFAYGVQGSEPSTDGFPTDAGAYVVRATLPAKMLHEDKGVYSCYLPTGTADVDVTIMQAATSLGLTVDKAAPVYGDAVTFSVTPSVSQAANGLRTASPMVEFFVVDSDGNEVSLGSAPVFEGVEATVSYSTAGKALAVGENVVNARVTGLPNLQDATEQVTVTLAAKPVTLEWSGIDDRFYHDGRQAAATAVGVLPGGDVSVSVEGGGSESVGENTATGSLAGEDARFYDLLADQASASYEVSKAPAFEKSAAATLLRLQPSATAEVDVAGLLPEGADGASFAVSSFTRNGLTSAEVDAATGVLALVADNTTSTAGDTVVVSITGLANYEDSTATVAVSYTDKPVAKVSGVEALSGLVYAGTPQKGYAGTPTATYKGGTYEGPFAVSYTGTGQTSYGPSPNAPTGAGDYAAIISVPADESTCAGSISLNFSIGKAPLAVTANDVEATYGEAAQAAGAAFEGFVADEGAGDLSGRLAYGFGDYKPGSNVGTYPVEPSGLASENYAISFKAGTLAVRPKALAAMVASSDPSASRAYDGTAAFAGVALALDGALAGDDVSVVADGEAADALAGTGKEFATTMVRLSGASSPNYALDPGDVSGTVSIAKAALVVRVKDAAMVAGSALPAFGYEVQGLAAGDKVLAPPTFSVEGDTSAPGACAIVPSGISVTNADCYDTSYEKGSLTVTAAGGGGNGGGGDGSGDPKKLAPTDDPLTAAPLELGLAAVFSGLAVLLVRRKVCNS